MRVALGVTAFATVYIGVMPNRFIEMVNWTLGLARHASVAQVMR
jgi:hypothetical protein